MNARDPTPTHPNSIVRNATPADLPAILAMLRVLSDAHVGYDAARFVPPRDMGAVYGPWLARATPGGDVLALVLSAADVGPGGPLTGYLVAEHFEAQPEYWSGPCVYVHDIYVEPEARATGAAAALLAGARAWAKARGMNQLRALVATANARSLAFFARQGFRQCAVEVNLDL